MVSIHKTEEFCGRHQTGNRVQMFYWRALCHWGPIQQHTTLHRSPHIQKRIQVYLRSLAPHPRGRTHWGPSHFLAHSQFAAASTISPVANLVLQLASLSNQRTSWHHPHITLAPTSNSYLNQSESHAHPLVDYFSLLLVWTIQLANVTFFSLR